MEDPKAGAVISALRHTDSVLDPAQIELLNAQVSVQPYKPRLQDARKYVSGREALLLSISCLSALAAGMTLPMMTVVFGKFQTNFQSYLNGETERAKFDSRLRLMCFYLITIAVAQCIAYFIASLGFLWIGDRIAVRIRTEFFRAWLHQSVAFFDQCGAGEVVVRVTSDSDLIRDLVSEKLFGIVAVASTFVSGTIIAFAVHWKLAPIQSSTLVVSLLVMGGATAWSSSFAKNSLHCYSDANAIAEEAISAVRTTQALGCEEKLIRTFTYSLMSAKTWNYKSKTVAALIRAGSLLTQWLGYGLGFWVGSKFISNGEVTVGGLLTVMFVVTIAFFSLQSVWPTLKSIMDALAAASSLLSVIHREPPVQCSPDAGITLPELQGKIELRDVHHRYPSRIDVPVLSGLDLTIPAGQVTALVGESGSGKSTIVGLLQRFYVPIQGSILVDDQDVSNLDLWWYRQ
ncbi:hypothetical protein OQA88_1837 [Cercophora sp. LCS_1]